MRCKNCVERWRANNWNGVTPYTRKLLSAVPVADPTRRRHRELTSDEIPSPIRALGDDPVVAPLREVAPGHFVAMHRVAGAY